MSLTQTDPDDAQSAGDVDISRRGFMRATAAGVAAGGLGAAGSQPVAAQSIDYGGWFDDVSNFDGTVDMTGQEEVRIDVGGGGGLAFAPAAVRVDPGTTVVWEWTGEGGQHNVYSDDPAFESPMQREAGATYGLEFDGQGVCKYACAPHEGAGMKGAVVVGDPAAASGGGGIDYLETALWGVAGAIVAAPFVVSELLARRRREGESGGRPRQPAD